jgi:hypothetical protein
MSQNTDFCQKNGILTERSPSLTHSHGVCGGLIYATGWVPYTLYETGVWETKVTRLAHRLFAETSIGKCRLGGCESDQTACHIAGDESAETGAVRAPLEGALP